jgi:hypothetical protein
MKHQTPAVKTGSQSGLERGENLLSKAFEKIRQIAAAKGSKRIAKRLGRILYLYGVDDLSGSYNVGKNCPKLIRIYT